FFINYLNDLSPVEFAREGKLSASKAAGGLLPPIVKGVAEDWANLSMYRGTEIVPYYMGKTQPPELQYKENTPESYKWLGKKLNVSPLRLQNFASNVLAGYGREGLDPSAMLRGLTGRLVRTTAGAKEQQAWVVIKDIEQGYTYTRAYADEMIAAGDRSGANRLMSEWNHGLDKRIQEITKFGVEDKGGLKRAYMFTPEKRKGLLLKRRDETKSPLEKKLSREK
ncbi:MAG: LPD38 domain-containing protein, partial [Methylococcales bacterium]|nr:LPD38 domain-containing protein [Methylococcales bacterium]